VKTSRSPAIKKGQGAADTSVQEAFTLSAGVPGLFRGKGIFTTMIVNGAHHRE
jgi:hypothetical protein